MFDEEGILEKFHKTPHRRLIGGRYLVEIKSAYFNNYYVSVEDMKGKKSVYTWMYGMFSDKVRRGKSAEKLYLYLNTAKKAKDFLDGKIVY